MKSVARRAAGGGVAVLAVAALSFLGIQMLSIHYLIGEVNQELHRTLARDLVEHMVVAWHDPDRVPDLGEQFGDLMRVNPAVDFYLLDASGRILAAGNPAEAVARDRVPLEPVTRLLSDPGGSVLGEDPREPGVERPISAAPIVVEGRLRGYLYVVLGSGRYARVVDMIRARYAVLLGAVVLLALLAVGAAAAALRYTVIVRRLRTLGSRMEAFRRAQGEGIGAAGAPTGDELARLEALFGELQARVAAQVDALERTDALRRELVAFVSHDLKKSLATVAGLIETLHTPPAPLSNQQRVQYLAAAERRVAALSKLIEQLFALARLEDPQIEPDFEAFSASDLARDVVQQHQVAAGRVGVRLSVSAGEVPQAWGEIGLVERVLANLIENAIRHTPTGGRVHLEVEPRGGRVGVAVRDTGPGIDPEDRPHLFELFYRGHATQPDDASAGLGLAIARRIVELHGGELEVESTPGAGSRFQFELPAAPR